MSDGKVILIREGVLQSVARDTFTFGALCFASWFINVHAGGSGWLNFMLAVVWFIWILGRAVRHKNEMTPAQARAWIDEHYPRESA